MWVYAYDIVGRKILPGRVVFAGKTKKHVRLVKVTLDNGEEVRCTLDHPFLLRNGEYRQAQDLRAGDSLMPLYRQRDQWGYEKLLENSSGKWRYTHRVTIKEPYPKVLRDALGRFRKSIIVHHKDFDKNNNCPENLTWMENSAHIKLHSKHAEKTIGACRNSVENKKRMRELSQRNRGNIEFGKSVSASWTVNRRRKQAERIRKINKDTGQNITASAAGHTAEASEKRRASLRAYWDGPDGIVARARKKEVSEKRRNSLGQYGNHKVVSVEFLDQREDVYDLTVEGHHNFALTAGVFVHNTLGGNVIAGVMDEVDSPNESEGQRKRVLQAYDKEEKSMGRFFLVASKQDELSFLEVFIADMKGSDKVVVYDKAQWEVRPSSDYCGERFLVSVGDAFTPPKLITAEEKNAEMEKNFKVIEIPVEHKFEFERDPIGALRDLAGISVKGLRLHKFVPGERFILAGFDNTKEDPVAFESMDIGLDEETELIQYIDLNKIRTPFDVPRCIHIDIAFSEDALALACSGIAEWRDMDVETPEGTFKRQAMPIVETDFVVRLKAKEGDRIPLHKIIKLILDLRSRKLNIRIVTIDLRVAAESSLQQLQRAGVTAEYMSVDKDNKAYIDWRHLLYDGRWRCHHQKWLHFELKNLEFDRVKNKINHPDKVKDMEFMEDGGVREMVVIGSKDCADAMVGSVYQALITGKVPVSAETVREQLGKIGGAAKGGGGLNPYSFIKTDRGPKHGSGSQVIKTGESTAPGGVEKMKEALKKLSRGKGGAGTIKWH